MEVYQTATAGERSVGAEAGGHLLLSFFATAGGEIVDEAADLASIVGRINGVFKLKTEDVAIWSVWADSGPRLVAYLTPGPKGVNRVVYVKDGGP